MPNIVRFADPEALARGAAEEFVALSKAAISAHGKFVVALSGGSTPKALFQLLASSEYSERIDWPQVFLFWGDERCVPPDDPQSNYRMTRESLLDPAKVPAKDVFRVHGEAEPQAAATAYEKSLEEFFNAAPSQLPRFDLVLLGLGDDGHTASLFPGTPAVHESTRWVVAQFVEKMRMWRVTLTPNVLNAAAEVIFLVSGGGKADILARVLTGPRDLDKYPAQIIAPTNGRLRWFVDESAAVKL